MKSILMKFLAIVLSADDVEWVVNDDAELGVKIGNRFFFLYKGHSIEYDGTHDDGLPMKYRNVWKREFGECCHPPSYYERTFDKSSCEFIMPEKGTR